MKRPAVPTLLFALIHIAAASGQSLVDKVNPFIGTSFGAHTFPGAIVPWGMVSVSPHTDLNDPSGYYWAWDNKLHGFGHVHLSGVGCFDLANIVLMPTVGPIETDHNAFASPIDAQIASPGFYGCNVRRYGVTAAVTATERAGLSRYIFASADSAANVLIDVTQGVSPSLGASVRIVGPDEVEGWNRSGRFCNSPTHQQVFFVARFSRSASSSATWKDSVVTPTDTQQGTSIGAAMRFAVARGDTILVKVGISYTSIDNARRNLGEEIPDWSFERVHERARRLWETELSRIRVAGGTGEQQTVFYTAIYHCLIHPSLFNDRSGDYRRMGDRGIGHVDGYSRYTVFSLWDTYRTLHPLLSMVWPERQRDMTRTMVEMYRENGWLPKWELAGMEAFSMTGDPASIVIADTWAKGIRDFDLETAFEGMLRNGTDTAEANWVRPGIAAYIEHGYIPSDHLTGHWTIYGPASTSLEYFVADAAVARIASALCRDRERDRFERRSSGHAGMFDRRLRLFRPRLANGSWTEPFDQEEDNRQFTEGTAHHYRFFAPHDMGGLVRMYGGEEAFTDALQSFFDDGRFMWNEHDLAYPYLFTFIDGQSWRTQRTVRSLMKDFGDYPWGIRTNEDAGAISAWYVLSAIGLFPVVYGTDEYQIGSPIFDTVTITPAAPNARPFVITAPGTSNAFAFIAAATLDGATLQRPQLRAREIAGGGRLALIMSAQPTQWGRMLRSPDSLAAHPPELAADTITEVLSWSSATDAVLFRVQVGTDATFCDPSLDTLVRSTDTAVWLRTRARPLCWRVASIDAHGAEAWSQTAWLSRAKPQGPSVSDMSVTISMGEPGPARIRCTTPDGDGAVAVVYDMLGREVGRTTIDACDGHPMLAPLLEAGLPKGPYLLRLVSRRGATTSAFLAR